MSALLCGGMVFLAGCGDNAGSGVQHSEVSPERKAEMEKQNAATEAYLKEQANKK